jgi:DNA-directed RNA polymerase specialized sigma24 family protein
LCPIELPAVANRLVGNSPSAETQLLARERLRRVAKIIDTLPARQRMDTSEISEAIGLNPNTVKSHLHRALAAIRTGVRQAESSEVQR